ncbi:MAG: hypothetical protein HGA22_01525 [Clostridiales bacterium]|nr:hypothetical protein [Clostridiales bacterium]
MPAVSGTIGASDIQEAASSLELAIKSDTPYGLLSVELEHTSRLLEAMVENLERFIPVQEEHPCQFQAVSDNKDLMGILCELKPFLEGRKPKKCAEALEKLRSLVWPAQLRQEAAELDRMTSRYKYIEALELLDSLINKVGGAG